VRIWEVIDEGFLQVAFVKASGLAPLVDRVILSRPEAGHPAPTNSTRCYFASTRRKHPVRAEVAGVRKTIWDALALGGGLGLT
jgi:hypothetical protein